MKQETHELVTNAAFNLIKDKVDSNHPILNHQFVVAAISNFTDTFNDLEFIDVDYGRDSDPHCGNDDEHYKELGMNFTAFNHFIDIKKGQGRYDDYDGYSYKKGSGSKDENQDGDDATHNIVADILGRVTGKKVDQGVNWWFNVNARIKYIGNAGEKCRAQNNKI